MVIFKEAAIVGEAYLLSFSLVELDGLVGVLFGFEELCGVDLVLSGEAEFSGLIAGDALDLDEGTVLPGDCLGEFFDFDDDGTVDIATFYRLRHRCACARARVLICYWHWLWL